MAYLLDTNVFIAAKNNYYGFDFCPAFWDWLNMATEEGVVRSVERVYDELIERGDDLSDWARDRRGLFLALGADDVAGVAAVNRWARDSSQYTAGAKADFASKADSFLVAQAMGGGHTVVTHETIRDSKATVKVPNAAAAHGVPFCTPFHMLRVERARFVLEGAE